MLGHASNLGRGDRGKFAAKVMVDFRDLLNLVNGHDICKSSFEKIKVKKNAEVRNIMLSSTAVKESELVE